jgi:hypothetical protein
MTGSGAMGAPGVGHMVAHQAPGATGPPTATGAAPTWAHQWVSQQRRSYQAKEECCALEFTGWPSIAHHLCEVGVSVYQSKLEPEQEIVIFMAGRNAR